MKRLSFSLLLIPFVAIGQVSVATLFSGWWKPKIKQSLIGDV